MNPRSRQSPYCGPGPRSFSPKTPPFAIQNGVSPNIAMPSQMPSQTLQMHGYSPPFAQATLSQPLAIRRSSPTEFRIEEEPFLNAADRSDDDEEDQMMASLLLASASSPFRDDGSEDEDELMAVGCESPEARRDEPPPFAFEPEAT